MGSQSHTRGYGIGAGLRPESLGLDAQQPSLHLCLEETPLGQGSDDAPGWARALLPRVKPQILRLTPAGIKRT